MTSPLSTRGPGPVPGSPEHDRLDSWKEIAAYLKRDVRTVQRWEKIESLPVHRHLHERRGSAYAFKEELDAWWNNRRLEIEEREVGGTAWWPRLWHFVRRKPLRPWLLVAAAVVLTAVATATWVMTRARPDPERSVPAGRFLVAPPPQKLLRVVVLPFENLGPPEDEYFASGVTEEITSRLAVITGLGVISRSSAAQYAKSGKSARQIGQELGAHYILEGGVRWQRDMGGPGRVRITPRLIRVADDTHVWAERYDRVLAEIFAVQAEIAERVAESLDLALLAPERAIESGATKSIEAYQEYLRGIHYSSRADSISPSGSRLIVESFERAVAFDPGFALAQARLSDAHSRIYRLGFDNSDTRLASARAAADRAREVQPDLPWAHVALGSYHYARSDYDRAFEEYVIAQKGMPGSSDVYLLLAATQRRQGRLDDALVSFQRTAELDPRSSGALREVALTYGLLRRYDEAIRYQDRAIAIDPNQVMTYWEKTATQLNSGRSLSEARFTLQGMPKREDPYAFRAWLRLELLARDYRAALARIQAQPDGFIDQLFFWPKTLLLADAYRLLGDSQRARSMYEEARVGLEQERNQRPDDPRVHSALGRVYAGLGRKDDAIREARLGVDLLPVSKDALRAPAPLEDLARVYTLVGEHRAALDTVERLLSIPNLFFSVRLLELDPAWDPLRTHPRYRVLVDTHGR